MAAVIRKQEYLDSDIRANSVFEDQGTALGHYPNQHEKQMQSHGNESHDFYEAEDLKHSNRHFDATTEPQVGFNKRNEADEI